MPVGSKTFLFSKRPDRFSGSLSFLFGGNQGSVLVAERLGEVDHYRASSVVVRMTGAIPVHPIYASMTCAGTASLLSFHLTIISITPVKSEFACQHPVSNIQRLETEESLPCS